MVRGWSQEGESMLRMMQQSGRWAGSDFHCVDPMRTLCEMRLARHPACVHRIIRNLTLLCLQHRSLQLAWAGVSANPANTPQLTHFVPVSPPRSTRLWRKQSSRHNRKRRQLRRETPTRSNDRRSARRKCVRAHQIGCCKVAPARFWGSICRSMRVFCELMWDGAVATGD